MVTQRDRNSSGLVPPWRGRTGSGRRQRCGPGSRRWHDTSLDWLNSKSMFVVPDGSWTRCQKR